METKETMSLVLTKEDFIKKKGKLEELMESAKAVLAMYPDDVYTGISGDDGVKRIIRLRKAVKEAEG